MADLALSTIDYSYYERGTHREGDHVVRHTWYGPGKCPKCGEETILKNGKFGEFYGCPNFPTCNGRRSL